MFQFQKSIGLPHLNCDRARIEVEAKMSGWVDAEGDREASGS